MTSAAPQPCFKTSPTYVFNSVTQERWKQQLAGVWPWPWLWQEELQQKPQNPLWCATDQPLGPPHTTCLHTNTSAGVNFNILIPWWPRSHLQNMHTLVARKHWPAHPPEMKFPYKTIRKHSSTICRYKMMAPLWAMRTALCVDRETLAISLVWAPGGNRRTTNIWAGVELLLFFFLV